MDLTVCDLRRWNILFGDHTTTLQVQDLLSQHNGHRYLASSLLGRGRHNPRDAAVPPKGDKIMVMASSSRRILHG